MSNWDIARIGLLGLWLLLCVYGARRYHRNPINDLRAMLHVIRESWPWN